MDDFYETALTRNALIVLKDPIHEGTDFIETLWRVKKTCVYHPTGLVASWAHENNIPVIWHSSGERFYLDPQTDADRFLIRMRWH